MVLLHEAESGDKDNEERRATALRRRRGNHAESQTEQKGIELGSRTRTMMDSLRAGGVF